MSRGAKFATAYLALVAGALVFGLAHLGDGESLSLIWFVLATAPWSFIGPMIATGPDGGGGLDIDIAFLVFGIVANALIAYRLGRDPKRWPS